MPTSTAIHQPLNQALATYPALIVPGLNNSDTQHWQTRWQAQLVGSRRIGLDNWATPNLSKWCEAIEQALATANEPSIVIAHSFGALASARMAELMPDKIRALFLVAPADPAKFAIAHMLPHTALSVKTTLIASTNDPWMDADKAAQWAMNWGAEFLRVKDLGHINSASNIADWPQGMEQLQRLVYSL